MAVLGEGKLGSEPAAPNGAAFGASRAPALRTSRDAASGDSPDAAQAAPGDAASGAAPESAQAASRDAASASARAGRTLEVVNAKLPQAVLGALELAMDGTGPAILPRRFGADVADVAGELLEPGAGPDAEELALPADAPRDACLVIETSGSTAAPKRVILTARALRASGAATYRRLDELAGRAGAAGADAFPSRQWLLALPAEYVAGAQVLARSIAAGTTPVVLPEGPFTAAAFLAACREMTGERRYTSLVPAQLIRLLDAAEGEGAAELAATLRGFDAILVGGQHTPPALRDRAAALGWRLVATYGSSESAGGCVYDGEPLPGVQVRAREGEIELSGPTLAEGYLGDPDRTADRFVLDPDGRRWYRTGDAGELEELGGGRVRLRVTGRLDDVIVSGGEKVMLGRVEAIVRAMPGLESAVVVPAPSEEWGQVPVVVVEGEAPDDPVDDGPVDRAAAGRDAADPDAADRDAADRDAADGEAADGEAALLAELRAAAAAALGRAAKPARLIRLPELPRLVSGKPDRRTIAELAAR